jgi:hypothetical protein
MKRTALLTAVPLTAAPLFAADPAPGRAAVPRESVQEAAAGNPASAAKLRTIAKDARTAEAVTENNADFHTIAQPN